MNVLFLSPNFPVYNKMFAKQLMKNDVRVLGVGDAAYDNFSLEQKMALTEYYFVPSLEDYDAVYRAAAYYIHKYGRLDKIVSFNAHWLPLESALRRDFSVEGIRDAAPLSERVFDVSYEAFVNGKGEPILAMSRAWNQGNGSYTLEKPNDTVQAAALKAVKALDVKSDFVTVELKKAGLGYSVVNAFAAPAPFAPDLFNYAFDFDIYSAWAYMLAGNEVEKAAQKHCISMIHAVDGREYPGVSAEYFGELEGEILQESPASDAMVNVGGDTVYLFTSDTEAKARGILSAFAGKEILPFAAAKTPARKPAAKAVKKESAGAKKENKSAAEKKTPAKRGRKPSGAVKATTAKSAAKEKTAKAVMQKMPTAKTEATAKTKPTAKIEAPKAVAPKAPTAKAVMKAESVAQTKPDAKVETAKAGQSASPIIPEKKVNDNKADTKKVTPTSVAKPAADLNKKV